jgi:hypothetical protein
LNSEENALTLRQMIAHDLDKGMHDIVFRADLTAIWLHTKKLPLKDLDVAIAVCEERGWVEAGGGGLRLTATMFD